MQKILLILVLVFSLAAAAAGFMNRASLIREKEAGTRAVAERDAANKDKASLSAELKTAKEKLSLVDSDIQKNASELADLRGASEKTASDITAAQKDVADKEAVIAQQKIELADKDSRIADLLAKTPVTAAPTTPSVDFQKQMEEKELLNESLQAKNKDLESQIAVLKQAEAGRKARIMRNGLEGRILAVNAAWNFVVLSLGDRNGVVTNAEMLIKRGSQLIGKVRVTSVEPSSSIADIVSNSLRKGFSVQPGDTVIYTGPEGESGSGQ